MALHVLGSATVSTSDIILISFPAASKDLASSPGGFLHGYMGGSYPAGRGSQRSASCQKHWLPCIFAAIEKGWGDSQYQPWLKLQLSQHFSKSFDPWPRLESL